MAYDRFDPRDPRSRWSDERYSDRSRYPSGEWRSARDNPDERGFFDRASDEVASWFGDEEAERRRREDRSFDRSRDWNENRGVLARGGSSGDDYNRSWRGEFWGRGDQSRFRERSRDYRPLTVDTSSGRFDDPHYRAMRERQLSELDRDYEEYRRERQALFESDFGSWRERRHMKLSLLGQIREHMEVVGNDDEHVGSIDCTKGDRLILTKSDPESGGVHHSLSCSDIDRIEGNRVILDLSAEQARDRWRDEERSRALFERDDQGEMGPRMLERSFGGTYR
jgi:hypothetical protein